MCGGYHLRVILGLQLNQTTQGHMPGYQPKVCGGYHLRVIHVLLSYYPGLHNLANNPRLVWWLSPGGYLDLEEKFKLFQKCFGKIKLAVCKSTYEIHQPNVM
jgi:hypothetical protein